jgi:class 3 adenylate cyclase/tetratricopeptide (TPR) repeat protein
MAEARKTVTIVFADVTGSTALGEQTDPEVMRRIMERYFDEMRSVLEKHGGTVEKFIGDAVMAVFGIPTVHEDDALRAVRAAAEMRERLAVLNAEFERERGITIAVRTGVNTGEVVAGDASSGQAFATGDAVNVAARLEQAAEPGEILLGPLTHQLVREAIRAEAVEPLELKGKAQAVEAWRLREVLRHAPAFTRRIDTPFVGRDGELEAIRSALERACQSDRPELVTVAAPAGTGKSRLAKELVADVGDDVRLLVGRCLPYGEGITYWPLAEMVRQVAGEDVEAGLADVLDFADDGRAVSAHLSSAVGVGEAPSRSEEIAWATRRLLETLAGEKPLVVVLDDVHWAEPTLLDLIEYVFGFAAAPLLLLCVARPELFETRPSWALPRPHATTILLEPLSEDVSRLLLESLTEGYSIPDALCEQIVVQAEGNPLFVEQMLAHLREDENGGTGVPPTVEALLAARIDSLPPDERAVVERGAIEGRLFHRGAVTAMLPEEARANANGHLMALVRRELVRPDQAEVSGEDAFRFAHVLVRDAAYAAIGKATRAEFHERYADWLESQAAARSAEFAEIIGYHLEQSVRYSEELGPLDDHLRRLARRAAERLGAAGRRAWIRGDIAAAANLIGRARALLPANDPERWGLLPDLVELSMESGAFERAGELVAEALESARTEHERAHADILDARLKILSEPDKAGERGLAVAERTIPVLDAVSDDRALIQVWTLVHEVHWTRGELGEAGVSAERALAHAQRIGDLRAIANVRSSVGASRAFGMATLDEAIEWGDLELEWARETGLRWHEAVLLCGLGAMRTMKYGPGTHRALIAQGQGILHDLGMRVTAAAMVANWAHLLEDTAEWERELRKSYETLKDAGERGYLSTITARLSDAVYSQGRLDEALALTEEAEAVGGADDVTTQITLRRVRAKVLARRGLEENAERLARDAAARAQATEYFDLQVEALTDLAAVLSIAGREQEAAATLESVLALYEQRGHFFGVERTRALLAELQSSGSPSQ